MIDQSIIDGFIALVTDGEPISEIDVCPTCRHGHYGPNGRARKDYFLTNGHAILHELALRLGCFGAGPYGGRWTMVNRAGGSVSGEVWLHAPHVRVTFSHRVNIGRPPLYEQTGFLFREPREIDVAGWLPWNALRNLDECARAIDAQLALKLPFNWRAHLVDEPEGTRERDEREGEGEERCEETKQALP